MANLPEALINIFKEIGLPREQATWDCHGTPVALHKALEQVAAHKRISFDAPTMIEADAESKKVVMLVSGRLTRSNGLSVRLQLTTIRIATPMQWQRSAQKTV